jgi:hypothetical protein
VTSDVTRRSERKRIYAFDKKPEGASRRTKRAASSSNGLHGHRGDPQHPQMSDLKDSLLPSRYSGYAFVAFSVVSRSRRLE